MSSESPRICEDLNQALRSALADKHVYLLGQDVSDPYGGAFGITRGLSTSYPDRVLSTPISESAMVGIAGGLALCGNRVIVELMFGDFIMLASDQLVNFATKAVSMYGASTPISLTVRCPVGGGRGYGPTHSQSLQKHFLGIPHLALYELSYFHKPQAVLPEIMARTEPTILFEDKALYAKRLLLPGQADDGLVFEYLDSDQNWAHAYIPGAAGPVVLLICTGGIADQVAKAARKLVGEDGIDAHILVPARLYPADIGPVIPMLDWCQAVWMVEESTGGGTWGADVATQLYENTWDMLRGPIRLLHSADQVIPSAPHLERHVLLQPETIRDRVRRMLPVRESEARARGGAAPMIRRGADQPPASSAHRPPRPSGSAPAASSHEVRIPKLNSNDASYTLVDWLAVDGSMVNRHTPIAIVETAKTSEEVVAGADGRLEIRVKADDDFAPGDIIARVMVAPDSAGPDRGHGPTAEAPAALLPTATPGPGADGPGMTEHHPAPADTDPPATRGEPDRGAIRLSEVPAAFSLARVALGTRFDRSDPVPEDSAPYSLAARVIVAIARQRKEFPLLFGSMLDHRRIQVADGVHVAISGGGLPSPGAVVRNSGQLDVDELARVLAEMPFENRPDHPATDGANIAVSLAPEADVLFVQPVIPPDLACIVSVSGPSEDLGLTEDGGITRRRVVRIGLAYDHRLVNGREANAFLGKIKKMLEEPPGSS